MKCHELPIHSRNVEQLLSESPSSTATATAAAKATEVRTLLLLVAVHTLPFSHFETQRGCVRVWVKSYLCFTFFQGTDQ